MPNLHNIFVAYNARPGSTLLLLKDDGGASPLFLFFFLSAAARPRNPVWVTSGLRPLDRGLPSFPALYTALV